MIGCAQIGAETAAAAAEWPRPLPVLLAPAYGEALSSWVARHARFFGVSRTDLLRHCAPDVPSLRLLDDALTPGQEARLAHLFRLDRASVRRITHAGELDRDVREFVVAHDLDHWCEPCAHSLAREGFPRAILRAWFHTWRITCARCGTRVSSSWEAAANTCGVSAMPDLFPHLWTTALEGERLLDAAVHRRTAATAAVAEAPIPSVRLLRLLMIGTGGDQGPAAHGKRQRQGWTLDAVVPGFDAALAQHEIAIPRTTLIDVPLPLRTALLAGFALAAKDLAAAIRAMWARTSGLHRAHFRSVLADMPGGHRFRPWIAA